MRNVKALVKPMNGWLSDREIEFLYKAASRASSKGCIVEIGSWQGKSTVVLGKGSLAGNKPHVYAVDPHTGMMEHGNAKLGSTLDLMKANLKAGGVESIVTPIVGYSQKVGLTWDKPISFLWIDGDHTIEGATLDFDIFTPHVIPGGTVAFHDATQGVLPPVVSRAFGQDGWTHIKLMDSIVGAVKDTREKSLMDAFTLFSLRHYNAMRSVPGAKQFKRFGKWMLAKV